MIPYQFAAIERLVDVALRRRSGTYEEISNDVLIDLKSETEKVMLNFKHILCTTVNAASIEPSIKVHQISLTSMMDTVHKELPDKQQKGRWIDGFKEVFQALDELLIFIQHHFGAYMNIDKSMPVYTITLAQNQFTGSLPFFEQGFSEAGIDAEYWDILMPYLFELSNADGTSYRRMAYLKELHQELTVFFMRGSEDFLTDLQNLLVFLNFNDYRYCAFMIKLLANHIASFTTFKSKLCQLSIMLKLIKQTPVKAGLSLIPSEPTLQKQLEKWIKNEMNSLEYLYQKQDQVPAASDMAKLMTYKNKVFMSVDQCAYMVHLNIETGIYEKKMNQTRYSEFFGQFHSTLETDWPAAGSFRSKIRRKDPAVVESVREILHKQLKQTYIDAPLNTKKHQQ